ncbi:MAG: class I SAM-dependent methyltransferase [Actinomycetota bacterium]
MIEQSRWITETRDDPDRSARYVERLRAMAAAGGDLTGEARFVNAMVPPSSRILDAGCGPGRVGGALDRMGHHVVGVDVDPVLIAAAEQDHPGPQWIIGDLAELDLAQHGMSEPFDVIVAAGNVMTYLAPSTRQVVLANLREHLTQDGRVVAGFAPGPDYALDEFDADVTAANLTIDLRLATWDLRPFARDSEFLVAVLCL